MNDAPRLGANPVSTTGNVSSILTGAANTEAAQLDRYNAMRDVGIDALGAYIAECDNKGRFPRQGEAAERVVSAMAAHAIRVAITPGICTLMDELESQPVYIDDATGA